MKQADRSIPASRKPQPFQRFCLNIAQRTDVGRQRDHNEDNVAYIVPKDALLQAKKGALFIVADGMGGHAAGESGPGRLPREPRPDPGARHDRHPRARPWETLRPVSPARRGGQGDV